MWPGVSGVAGQIVTRPSTRSGWSAVNWIPHVAPHDSPTRTARSVPVASNTAPMSSANSKWEYASLPTGADDIPVPLPSNVTTR